MLSLTKCLDSTNHHLQVADIADILATYEGEPDGHDWRWIVKLNSGRYAFIRGGCTAEDGYEDDWYVASIICHTVNDVFSASIGGIAGLDSIADLILNDFQNDDERLDVYGQLRESYALLGAPAELASRPLR